MLSQCWEVLTKKLGITSINAESFEVVARLVFAFFDSAEGKKFLLKEVLNAHIEDGSYLKQYYSRNGMGERQGEIDYRTLKKATVFLFDNGKGSAFVNPAHIAEINEPVLVECDSTHVRMPKTYCVITLKGSDGRPYNLSNHARMHSENQDIRSTSNAKICGSCEYTRCPYNPDRAPQIAPGLLEHKPTTSPFGMRQ